MKGLNFAKLSDADIFLGEVELFSGDKAPPNFNLGTRWI
jgi:hypothetical protein